MNKQNGRIEIDLQIDMGFNYGRTLPFGTEPRFASTLLPYSEWEPRRLRFPFGEGERSTFPPRPSDNLSPSESIVTWFFTKKEDMGR